jgi:hypothetical protein
VSTIKVLAGRSSWENWGVVEMIGATAAEAMRAPGTMTSPSVPAVGAVKKRETLKMTVSGVSTARTR